MAEMDIIALRLPRMMVQQIKELSIRERRTRSNMAMVLLEESLNARRERTDACDENAAMVGAADGAV